VKCRSRSLTVNNVNSYWLAHALAQKITETTKSLEICYYVFISKLYVDRLKRCTNSEWAALSRGAVIERAVGEGFQRLPLAFMLEEVILSTCCTEDDVK